MGVGYLLDVKASDSWLKLVRRFERILRDKLGDNLVRIIARSSPEDLVYESNVLVVVRRADLKALREVSRAALEAMERTGLEGISPMTVEEGELDELG